MKIDYARENDLGPFEFIEVLKESGLAERRPVEDMEQISAMLEKADLVITARVNGKLVGVARSLSDFSYATYLSDLAVSLEFQHQGIGKELIRQTKLATGKAKLILLSAPAAVDYYPRIGMTHHNHCYFLDTVNDLK
jgi:predicted N-acetyltransferase YhbS